MPKSSEFLALTMDVNAPLFCVPTGKSSSGSWAHFSMLVTQNIQDHIDSQLHAAIKAAPDILLNHVINHLVIECQCIELLKSASKSRPNLEYCNHARSSSDVIHKHEKNPDGILCSNCGKKSHDALHCYAKRGGMEGQGPKFKAKSKAKSELTAIATTGMTTVPDLVPPSTAYLGDLSCAAIDEPSIEEMTALLAARGNSANCLDSGTSSHLFKDQSVFWIYNVTQARAMRTANHGVLHMEASGDCLVHFTLKGVTTTIKL